MPRWIEKWAVEGSRGNQYMVSKAEDGTWGCSCPRWKFRREECKHIQEIKAELSRPRVSTTARTLSPAQKRCYSPPQKRVEEFGPKAQVPERDDLGMGKRKIRLRVSPCPSPE